MAKAAEAQRYIMFTYVTVGPYVLPGVPDVHFGVRLVVMGSLIVALIRRTGGSLAICRT